MKDFVALFKTVDQTTKSLGKIAALKEYFRQADPKDKIWTVALFTHKRPKRTVSTSLLRQWAAEKAQIPLWLFEESYHIVGDLAEAISLVLPKTESQSNNTLDFWMRLLLQLANQPENLKKETILNAWEKLDKDERFLFNKLLTGGFRIGLSQKSVVKALSLAYKIEEQEVAHRLMGNWNPAETSLESLLTKSDTTIDLSKPYPFYLAYALEKDTYILGDIENWQAEYKWDGIRGQIICRNQKVFVWSRGEELISDKFPEYHILESITNTNFVLDGEILPYKEEQVLPFQRLQTRLGRKNISSKLLRETPVIFKAYDLLELDSRDLRKDPLNKRRLLLEDVIAKINSPIFQLSEAINFQSWEELKRIRENTRNVFAEGLMLKNLQSSYKQGRKKGDWWKWKVDPLTIDAVMLYAQRGHGRRANLYTDFTFAVWEEDKLVPIAKAYSGLTDLEFQEISKWVKSNALERFGPVCSVPAKWVFELAFEGISESTRHKSGVALRFPRIIRWRKDKPVHEANTLEDLKRLLVGN